MRENNLSITSALIFAFFAGVLNALARDLTDWIDNQSDSDSFSALAEI